MGLRQNKDSQLNIKDQIDIATYILDKQLYFISTVDTRASMLLAANLGLTAVAISLIDFYKWQSLTVGLLSLAGIITSTTFTYLAIRPSNIDVSEPDNLIYWGHTSRKRRESYIRELTTALSKKILQDTSNEIFTLSVIVNYKYRKMKLAIDMFALSVLFMLALVIVNNLI